MAVEQDIGASATFQSGATVSAINDMDFGTITYAAAANNTIHLRTGNGGIVCSNTSDYECPATGTRGSFTINGTIGAVVEISCDADGNLSNGTDILPYDRVRGKINGINERCKGLGTVIINHTLSSTVSQNVLVSGMRINVPAAGITSPGLYDTAQAGADPVSYRVVYQ